MSDTIDQEPDERVFPQLRWLTERSDKEPNCARNSVSTWREEGGTRRADGLTTTRRAGWLAATSATPPWVGEHRAVWGGHASSSSRVDAAYGLRQVRRIQGFSLIAIATLGSASADHGDFSAFDTICCVPLRTPTRTVSSWSGTT